MKGAGEGSLPWGRRPMAAADLDRVLAIENQVHSHPWSRGIFADCLQGPYYCHVGELHGRIVGYSVHSAAAGEAHLLNLAVAPSHQGQGLGRYLLQRVLADVRALGARTLFLEVRQSNRAAQALYESEGFNEVGRRFDYYPAEAGREDALIYARELTR